MQRLKPIFLFIWICLLLVPVASAQTLDPTDGETVTQKLHELRLEFDQSINHARVIIIRGVTEFEVEATIQDDQKTLLVTFNPAWEKGDYQIDWTVETENNEALKGTYHFEYDPEPTPEEKRVGTVLIVVSVTAFIGLLIWQRYQVPPKKEGVQ